MKTLSFALVLLAPVVAGAQATAGASASTQASASVEMRHEHNDSTTYHAPSRFSARTRAQLEAMVEASRKRGTASRALVSRIAEAEAKGATDAQVIASSKRFSAQLQSSHDVLVRVGRQRPSDEEQVAGASALARGFTQAQLEAAVRGGNSTQAAVLAAVETMMNSRVAAQGSVDAAGSVGGNGAGTSAVGGAAAGVGSGVSAGAAAAGSAAGGLGGVAGGVTGSAIGGVRKP